MRNSFLSSCSAKRIQLTKTLLLAIRIPFESKFNNRKRMRRRSNNLYINIIFRVHLPRAWCRTFCFFSPIYSHERDSFAILHVYAILIYFCSFEPFIETSSEFISFLLLFLLCQVNLVRMEKCDQIKCLKLWSSGIFKYLRWARKYLNTTYEMCRLTRRNRKKKKEKI